MSAFSALKTSHGIRRKTLVNLILYLAYIGMDFYKKLWVVFRWCFQSVKAHSTDIIGYVLTGSSLESGDTGVECRCAAAERIGAGHVGLVVDHAHGHRSDGVLAVLQPLRRYRVAHQDQTCIQCMFFVVYKFWRDIVLKKSSLSLLKYLILDKI